MRSKLIHEDAGKRTFAVIFDKGDEVVAGLQAFAADNGLGASSVTAIGAFEEVVLGYFDRDRMDYKRSTMAEQLEVLSLVGDVAVKDGEPNLHAHVVLGREDFSALGGHLVEAKAWPTLEAIVTESPDHLQKSVDDETGLALIDIARS